MATNEKLTSVQVFLSKGCIERADVLAAKLGMTRTRFFTNMAEIGVENDEFLLEMVAGFCDFVKLCGYKGGKGKKDAAKLLQPQGS